MPIDPTIALRTQGAQPISLGQMNQIFQMRQQHQQQNALLSILRQPGAVDAFGAPTPNALREISQLNPMLGMKFRQQEIQGKMLGMQEKGAQFAYAQKKQKGIQDAITPAVNAYEDAIQKGMPPAQAQQIGAEEYQKARQDLAKSGMYSPQDLASLPSTFNYQQLSSGLLSYKDKQQLDAQKRAEKRMEEAAQGTTAFRKAELDMQAARLAQTNEKLKMMEKMGQPVDLRADPDTLNFLADQYNSGNHSVLTGLGRGKIGSMNRMLVVQRAAQIAKGEGLTGADLGARMYTAPATYRYFSSGKGGQNVQSINVGLNHLDTLQKLSDALDNGNIQKFNKVAQAYAKETGSPAPTNFDSAKQIIGDEIVKAIIGAGGSDADRQEAKQKFSRVSSPQQIKGAIDTIKQLFVGQMDGLGKRYEGGTGRKDFAEKYLTGEARRLYESGQKGAKAEAKTLTYDPATGGFK